MVVSYATAASNLATLKVAGAHLLGYVAPLTAIEHDDAVAVLAQRGWDESGKSMTFGLIYKLHADGWHLTEPDVRPFPAVARAIDAQATPDRDSEQEALSRVKAWLDTFDSGDVASSRSSAAPVMTGRDMQERWTALMALRAGMGRLVSRLTFSVTESDEVPKAPRGRYVTVQFRTTFEHAPSAVEALVAMLCDDGIWRVAGYDLFVGNAVAWTVVGTDPRP